MSWTPDDDGQSPWGGDRNKKRADKNNSFSLRCHFRQKMISKTVLATTFTTNLE